MTSPSDLKKVIVTSTPEESSQADKEITEDSALKLSPNILNEESGFTNILNVSDLERDEVHCRQNWSYLPIEKFNFSLTGIENSRINPPNFMPAEDSLFQELISTNSDSMQVMKYNSSYRLSKSETVGEIEPNFPGEQRLEKGNDEIEFGIPSIQDISYALKCCDDNANPMALIDEIMRAGAKSSRSLACSDLLKQSASADATLTCEDVVTFSSVGINETQSRAVHLLNFNTSGKMVKYQFTLEGSQAFRIFEQYSKNDQDIYSVLFNREVYELYIAFCPLKLGPVSGILTVSSMTGVKKVHISGFGGKAHCLMYKIVSYLSDSKSLLILDNDLTACVQLENAGTAPAFYHINFGELEYFCQPDTKKCGIIYQGKAKTLKFHIIKDKNILINLLNFFSTEHIAEIGNITLSYGDEASRQRLKRLSRYYNDSGLAGIVSKNFPHLLLDYSEIPFNFDSISDNTNSVPHLIQEGIHHIDLKLVINKHFLKSALFAVLK